MMKKFISVIAALAMIFAVSANAQTVESSRMFENISVTLDGGVFAPITSLNENVFDNIKPTAGLEITKYFTPVVGFGVQGIANFSDLKFADFPKNVNNTVVLGNAKVNVSNWFGGYKGYPRRIELVGTAGLGWGHNYGPQVEVANYTAYAAGAELNVNMGKARAWQLNFRPEVIWHNQNAVYPKLSKNDADLRVAAGITYKFGSKKRGHNFRLCPYSVTQADYDALLAKYNELEKNPKVIEKETIKETVVIKEVPVEKKENVWTPMNVTFAMGSAKLSNVEKAKIKEFVEGLDVEEVLVVGSADKGTGTAKRNEYLAKERANVVAKFLENLGIKAKVQSTMDIDEDSPEASRAAIIDVNVR